jgi:hypothetical protein
MKSFSTYTKREHKNMHLSKKHNFYCGGGGTNLRDEYLTKCKFGRKRLREIFGCNMH